LQSSPPGGEKRKNNTTRGRDHKGGANSNIPAPKNLIWGGKENKIIGEGKETLKKKKRGKGGGVKHKEKTKIIKEKMSPAQAFLS